MTWFILLCDYCREFICDCFYGINYDSYDWQYNLNTSSIGGSCAWKIKNRGATPNKMTSTCLWSNNRKFKIIWMVSEARDDCVFELQMVIRISAIDNSGRKGFYTRSINQIRVKSKSKTQNVIIIYQHLLKQGILESTWFNNLVLERMPSFTANVLFKK